MKQIIIYFFIFIFSSCIFSAGTNRDAVIYSFNKMSSKELFDKIDKLKMNEPKYRLLNKWDNPNSEIVDQYDKINNQYNVFFFFKEESLGFQCIIDPNRGGDNAVLLLMAVSTRDKDQMSKVYNMEKLSKKEKNNILTKFESRILDKLGSWSKLRG